MSDNETSEHRIVIEIFGDDDDDKVWCVIWRIEMNKSTIETKKGSFALFRNIHSWCRKQCCVLCRLLFDQRQVSIDMSDGK